MHLYGLIVVNFEAFKKIVFSNPFLAHLTVLKQTSKANAIDTINF